MIISLKQISEKNDKKSVEINDYDLLFTDRAIAVNNTKFRDFFLEWAAFIY